MIIIGEMCLHFLKMSCIISKMLYLFLFCQIEHESYLKKQKKEKNDLFFGYIWNVGKWTCYIMQARNLLHYKKEMNKRGIRSHRCLLKRKKWNVEDIGVVHWNDILLLLVGCFGHQCAVGGIMMIWGCHLLANV